MSPEKRLKKLEELARQYRNDVLTRIESLEQEQQDLDPRVDADHLRGLDLAQQIDHWKATHKQVEDTLIPLSDSAPPSTMIVRCIVPAHNAGGAPDLYFVKVECTEGQYDNGYHYDVAKEAAINEGYEPDRIVFDENDPGGRAMLDLFEWDTATVWRV